jgi:hypothetical protein
MEIASLCSALLAMAIGHLVNKKGCLSGAALFLLQVYRLSLSPDEDPGCPNVKWVLNPKEENQDDNQNSDREIDVHKV